MSSCDADKKASGPKIFARVGGKRSKKSDEGKRDDAKAGGKPKDSAEGEGVEGERVKFSALTGILEVTINGETTQFGKVERLFQRDASQREVGEALIPTLLDDVREFTNVCCFAYGQTGTGKTYSMLGDAEHPGIIPQFSKQLDEMIKKMEEQGYAVEVKVSCAEVYLGQVYDLLATPKRILDMYLVPGIDTLEGVTRQPCDTDADIVKAFRRGQRKRCAGETASNQHSSRSHGIFQITVKQKAAVVDGVAVPDKWCAIWFVDLAGSESTNAAISAQVKKEGTNINEDLYVLGRVIDGLVNAATTNAHENVIDGATTSALTAPTAMKTPVKSTPLSAAKRRAAPATPTKAISPASASAATKTPVKSTPLSAAKSRGVAATPPPTPPPAPATPPVPPASKSRAPPGTPPPTPPRAPPPTPPRAPPSAPPPGVPWRDSRLTEVLRDAVCGSCKLVMLATVSDDLKKGDESKKTLEFALRTRQVKKDVKPNVGKIDSSIQREFARQQQVIDEQKALLDAQKKHIDDVEQKLRSALERAGQQREGSNAGTSPCPGSGVETPHMIPTARASAIHLRDGASASPSQESVWFEPGLRGASAPPQDLSVSRVEDYDNSPSELALPASAEHLQLKHVPWPLVAGEDASRHHSGANMTVHRRRDDDIVAALVNAERHALEEEQARQELQQQHEALQQQHEALQLERRDKLESALEQAELHKQLEQQRAEAAEKDRQVWQQQVEQAEAEVIELKKRLDGQSTEAGIEIARLTTEVRELKVKYRQAQDENESLDSARREAAAELCALRQQLDEVRASWRLEVDSLEAQCGDEASKLAAAEATIRETDSALAAVRASTQTVQHALELAEVENGRVKEAHASEVAELEERLRAGNELITTLKADMADLEANLTAERASRNQTELRLAALEDSYDGLRRGAADELQSVRDTHLRESSALVAKYKELCEESEAAQRDLTTQLQAVGAQSIAQEHTVETLQAELAATQESRDSATRNNAQLTEQLADRETRARDEQAQLTHALQLLRTELDEARESAAEEAQRLRTEVADAIRIVDAKLATARSELETERRKNADLTNDFRRLSERSAAERKAAEERDDAGNAALTKLREEHSELRAAHDGAIEERDAALRGKKDAEASLAAAKDELARANTRHVSQMHERDTAIESLRNELHDVEGTVGQLRSTQHELEAAIANVKRQHATELARADTAVRELQRLRDELKSTAADREAIAAEKEKLVAQLRALKGKLLCSAFSLQSLKSAARACLHDLHGAAPTAVDDAALSSALKRSVAAAVAASTARQDALREILAVASAGQGSDGASPGIGAADPDPAGTIAAVDAVCQALRDCRGEVASLQVAKGTADDEVRKLRSALATEKRKLAALQDVVDSFRSAGSAACRALADGTSALINGSSDAELCARLRHLASTARSSQLALSSALRSCDRACSAAPTTPHSADTILSGNDADDVVTRVTGAVAEVHRQRELARELQASTAAAERALQDLQAHVGGLATQLSSANAELVAARELANVLQAEVDKVRDDTAAEVAKVRDDASTQQEATKAELASVRAVAERRDQVLQAEIEKVRHYAAYSESVLASLQSAFDGCVKAEQALVASLRAEIAALVVRHGRELDACRAQGCHQCQGHRDALAKMTAVCGWYERALGEPSGRDRGVV